MRTAPEVTLPLRLEPGRALPPQLTEQFRELIASAVLSPGDVVPSSRALAAHLGISRGSVVAAYDQLLAEGYFSSAGGRSTVVNPLLRRVHPVPARTPTVPAAAPTPTLDLRPGRPWPDEVVGPAWKAAWRHAASRPLTGTTPDLGLPELRSAWAEHLRRMRAVVRDPAQIVVTAGGREGLALLLRALTPSPLPHSGPMSPTATDLGPLCEEGRLRVGVEEPGYLSLRRVPARLGCEIVALATDEHGLRIADLPTGREAPEVILVTPSHQYPLGGSLPVDRRQALLDWARRNRVIIVEDDYDSELRYTSQPLPALASLDSPGDPRVVMLGTLSKILTPALAMGFLALPDWLVPAVADARADLGQPVGLVPQRALANYLDAGALRLHTQRMRQRYRRRRALVVRALAGIPGLDVYPMDGGLHAVVETRRDEAGVMAALTASGVRVSPLSQYWSGTEARQGIVFGFGAVSEADLARGLTLIAAAAAPGSPTGHSSQ
ncbi:MAG: PLP-dependent aminotransferase family protein [Propionicimonas sp.]